MGLKTVKIKNFKSFNDVEINLSKFNVLIGPNAAGKSNFIRIFAFLRDIRKFGLENAISLQGGVKFLRNIKIGSSENLIIETVSEIEALTVYREKPGAYRGIEAYEAIYKISLKFNKRGFGFDIVEDSLTFKCNTKELIRKGNRFEVGNKLGRCKIAVKKIKSKLYKELEVFNEIEIPEEEIFGPKMRGRKHDPKKPLLEISSHVIPFPWKNIFDIAINDFDPKLPQKATPITGKIELEEDASNLAIVINGILKKKEESRKFLNLLKDLLPFVEKMKVERYAGKSLLIKLEEVFSKGDYLLAPFLSDGTINIISLIAVLYFTRHSVIVVEEPERNIHPYLIDKIVEMMKDASGERQVFVTTHNAEIVRAAGLDDLLFISRDKDGFSIVTKPSEKKHVKKFLEQEIGIEELFAQNLIEE
jgi:predicted ATPase